MPKIAGRVLEIGCGEGQTLAMLKSSGLCSETVGIELMPQAADKAASQADRVYCLNVEQQALPQDMGRFDVVLLLDVLEHLVDPWSFMKNLVVQCLAADGKVIVSIPNAQHFSLVWPLLWGRFDYTERGILDKTHLRFFTRRTAIGLLETAGLKSEVMQRTSLGLHLNSGKVNLLTLGLFSDFLSSQYIFRASAVLPS